MKHEPFQQLGANGKSQDYAQLMSATKSSSLIGAGKSNTEDVLKIVPSSVIPQSVCSKFNFLGYSDWFLPSAQEMVQLMIFAKTDCNINFLKARQYMTSTLDKESKGETDKFYSIEPNLKNSYAGPLLFHSEKYISFVPIRMEKVQNVDKNK